MISPCSFHCVARPCYFPFLNSDSMFLCPFANQIVDRPCIFSPLNQDSTFSPASLVIVRSSAFIVRSFLMGHCSWELF